MIRQMLAALLMAARQETNSQKLEMPMNSENDWNKLSDDDWREKLTDQQFHVTRQGGTERAFTGEYHDCKESGTYKCVCCGAPLFSSIEKYDSGSGWPSFWQPLDQAAVETEMEPDTREEVHCVRCKAHLGHVFPDGPRPTGLRYCINSASLKLDKDGEEDGDKDAEDGAGSCGA